jgi:membrane protein YqaA with SNARE-associated domain
MISWLLNNFLTWWGALLLGALDSSLFVFVPFGTDAVVVYLCARDPSLFWLYPLLVTAGSVAGAAGTYLIGVKIGDAGLSRFVARRRLERLRRRGEGHRRVRDGTVCHPAAAVPADLRSC